MSEELLKMTFPDVLTQQVVKLLIDSGINVVASRQGSIKEDMTKSMSGFGYIMMENTNKSNAIVRAVLLTLGVPLHLIHDYWYPVDNSTNTFVMIIPKSRNCSDELIRYRWKEVYDLIDLFIKDSTILNNTLNRYIHDKSN